jgi:hypothetical protein
MRLRDKYAVSSLYVQSPRGASARGILDNVTVGNEPEGNMRIPQDATIALEKLTGYLLVYRSRSDKSRFLAQAGYSSANVHELERSLRLLIADGEAVIDRQDEYGIFYRVEGQLLGPQGVLRVVTIWIQQAADGEYKFVTLKPRR